ncbi:MAG: ABC transporter permease [Trueperaceae bacterium]|nr:MAG: ABC transporter permease [Trueperaceae bacterium]
MDSFALQRAESRSLWQDAFRRFRRNGLAVAGLVVIAIFLLMGLIGPWIAPYDFLAQDLFNILKPPTPEHWLGTDELGRDIFSRLLYGARTAALVAFSTTAISLALGILVGTWAGLQGGRVDQFLMWISDQVQAVPGLLLVMLINTALRRPIINWFDRLYEQTRNPFYLNTNWLDFVLVFSALALIAWPGFARLIRGQVLSVSQEDYVLAARALGTTEMQVMLRHVVPNSLGPLVIAVTANMGAAVVLEAGLSFLGLGVQPPNASWGTMLSDSLRLWQSFPHLLIGPAATIGFVQLAFVFLGDGLNDALDPRRVT